MKIVQNVLESRLRDIGAHLIRQNDVVQVLGKLHRQLLKASEIVYQARASAIRRYRGKGRDRADRRRKPDV